MMTVKQLILTIITLFIFSLVGFVLGWIFPVEGPLDYTYDAWASQPAHKHPKKTAPIQIKQLFIDVNDLSQEDFEALQEIFRN